MTYNKTHVLRLGRGIQGLRHLSRFFPGSRGQVGARRLSGCPGKLKVNWKRYTRDEGWLFELMMYYSVFTRL